MAVIHSDPTLMGPQRNTQGHYLDIIGELLAFNCILVYDSTTFNTIILFSTFFHSFIL